MLPNKMFVDEKKRLLHRLGDVVPLSQMLLSWETKKFETEAKINTFVIASLGLFAHGILHFTANSEYLIKKIGLSPSLNQVIKYNKIFGIAGIGFAAMNIGFQSLCYPDSSLTSTRYPFNRLRGRK